MTGKVRVVVAVIRVVMVDRVGIDSEEMKEKEEAEQSERVKRERHFGFPKPVKEPTNQQLLTCKTAVE